MSKTTEMQELENLILTEDVAHLVGLAKSNLDTVSTAVNTYHDSLDGGRRPM